MSASTIAALLMLPLLGAPPESTRDEPLELMRALAAQYEVTLGGDEASAAALRPEPLLRWTNPTRETEASTLFLFHQAGRPVAVLCLFRFQNRYIHELQSLAQGPLRATYPADTAWMPDEPGLVFAPLPNAPTPASTPVGRLLQMRSMARHFGGSVRLSQKQPDALRLLPQPLYRYPDSTPGAADGAIFALVQTTDPEVLLLLEVRDTTGQPAWHYALARMSSNHLECTLDGAVIWTREADYTYQSTKPYTQFRWRKSVLPE